MFHLFGHCKTVAPCFSLMEGFEDKEHMGLDQAGAAKQLNP